METLNCRSDRRQTGKNVVYIFDENRKQNSKKQQNRKTEVFGTKTENPNAPLLSLACLRPWWHYTTLLSTAVKAIHGVLREKKNFQMSVHSIVSRRRDIMAVT